MKNEKKEMNFLEINLLQIKRNNIKTTSNTFPLTKHRRTILSPVKVDFENEKEEMRPL